MTIVALGDGDQILGPARLELSTAFIQYHEAEDHASLREAFVASLSEIAEGASFAVLLHENKSRESLVDVVHGNGILLEERSRVERDVWMQMGFDIHPLCARDKEIGVFLLCGSMPAQSLPSLVLLLQHFALALLRLTIAVSAESSLRAASSTLQALEEGVVLFREEDPAAITARFLQLCLDYFSAKAGAVFLLEDLEDIESSLKLDQVMGLPESFLSDLTRADGSWWIEDLAKRDLVFLERDGRDGELAELADKPELAVLENLIAAPLGYHGVVVGAIVLFNADHCEGRIHFKLDRAMYLFELGAAVLHRRQLEAKAIRAKELETQIQIASVIQARLIPCELPEHEHLEFAWRSVMSQQVGGDYLDCLIQDDGTCLLTIADVSGHGIDSALLMTSFRSAYCHAAISRMPDELLEQLNEVVRHEVGGTGMFLTCAALEIDRDGASFRFASAGHNPVLLYRAADGRFEELEASGPPLGFFPSASYSMAEHRLAAGDFLLLYTDGLVEASPLGSDGEEEDMFGLDRLKDIAQERAGQSPAELLAALYDSVETFSARERQEDDVSILIVKRVGL